MAGQAVAKHGTLLCMGLCSHAHFHVGIAGCREQLRVEWGGKAARERQNGIGVSPSWGERNTIRWASTGFPRPVMSFGPF